jgi:hypothetical protein
MTINRSQKTFETSPEFEQSVQMQKIMTPLEHMLGKPEDIALVVA